MADVTGSIGNEYVELNNAATEVTLRQLLAAVQKQGGSAGAVGSTAGAAGVNTASIEAAKAAAKAQKELGEKADNLKQTFSALASGMMDLTGKLLQGTDKSSDLFSAFEKLPGAAGMVASAFAKVARFQEENLGVYQKITSAGVNFGGSLTDMRTAAASTYMTLTEFGDLMKSNGASFAKMGGSVDAGARAFVGISSTLNKSEMGTGLRALGYTTQEVNQGMIDYIAISGGRTQKEMQNTSQLAKESANYLEQLDGLSKLTGESKEALAAKMKDDAAAQAFEGYLLTLDKDSREKAISARLEAEARGGKGAAQALQAKLMGLPPMTEAAQKFVGTMQGGNNALDGLASNVKDSSKSLDDVKKSGAGLSAGLAQDGRNLKQVASAQIMAGKDVELFGKALKASNDATRNGVKNTQEQIAFEQKIAEEAKKQKESEAKAAVENQKAMQELGQSILSILMPAIKLLTAVINPLAKFVSAVMTQFEKLNGIAQGLVVAGLALLAFQKLKKARQDAGQIPTGSSGGSGGPGGSGTGKGLAGKFAGSLKGGLGGIAGGLALGAAADYAASNGMEKTGAGLDIASTAASFAGTGAMLGSIVPGAGTALGAGLGAAAGGAYGLYQNWGKLFGESGQKKAADGLMVNTPTSILAGEAGPEIVAPTRHFENLQNELQTLNKQTAEMLRYLKETAESTRNSNDSIKNLGGDLFKF
jgi:hypothetical protein